MKPLNHPGNIRITARMSRGLRLFKTGMPADSLPVALKQREVTPYFPVSVDLASRGGKVTPPECVGEKVGNSGKK